MKRGRQLSVIFALIALLAIAHPAFAKGKYDVGATDTEIKIGDIHPLSGPASSYGIIGLGNKAYFDQVNERGGINGRKVQYILADDSYSPPKTVEQARRLVEKEKVLLIFNALGTPGNTAIFKYMNQKKVPQLFVSSGSSKWGKNPKKYPWTMGYEPTYFAEGVVFIKHALKTVPNPKFGILYQNDDLGKDFLAGVKQALGDKAKKLIVAELSYEVSDPTVDSQIIQLKNSGANVFLNISIIKFAAMAIRKAYDINWRPVHYLPHLSSSIDLTLKPAGVEKSKGIISAGWIRDPADPNYHNYPDYKEWLAWMNKYFPKEDKGSLWLAASYVYSYGLHQVLLRCGDDLTRENVMRQAASLKDVEVPLLYPGIVVNTSPTDYYPVEQYQLIRFDGTKWAPFGEVIDASKE